VRYRRWRAPTDVERRLEPYGLVLKAGRWYVIASAGTDDARTYRVDQILQLHLSDEEFEPPADFDLAAYWRAYQDDFHGRLHSGDAVVRLAPGAADRLPGPAAREAAHATARPEPDGWTRAVVPIESVDHAHDEFLRLGADIEVLEPADLRHRIQATVEALAGLYGRA
jgi:predicted DNA-binding transcriptional regulator YafY